MNLTKLREWLIAQGFQIYKQGERYKPWLAAKNINHLTPFTCETNTDKLNIIVTAFDFPDHVGVEVDLTGEANSRWYKFLVYGFSTDDFTAQYTTIEADLLAAWNTIHKGAK